MVRLVTPKVNRHNFFAPKTRSFKSNLHREVGFFIRTHIKKSLKNVNKKGTCKFNINLFIIITGSIPLLANYRSVVSVYALTSFIRYTSYWNCLNNVIIIKTKALFPQAIGDVSRFWRSCWCLLVYFHPQLLTLSGFPIFRHWGYQMKVIPETWSAH